MDDHRTAEQTITIGLIPNGASIGVKGITWMAVYTYTIWPTF